MVLSNLIKEVISEVLVNMGATGEVVVPLKDLEDKVNTLLVQEYSLDINATTTSDELLSAIRLLVLDVVSQDVAGSNDIGTSVNSYVDALLKQAITAEELKVIEQNYTYSDGTPINALKPAEVGATKNIVRTGYGVPNNSIGTIGDIYANLQDNSIWVYTASGYVGTNALNPSVSALVASSISISEQEFNSKLALVENAVEAVYSGSMLATSELNNKLSVLDDVLRNAKDNLDEALSITLPSITQDVSSLYSDIIPSAISSFQQEIQAAETRVTNLASIVDNKLRALEYATDNETLNAAYINLTALTEVASIRKAVTDAGITIDPSTGKASLWALNEAENKLSNVAIEIDAINSTLSQKVTFAEVDQVISNYVLDPAQLPELEGIRTQLTDLFLDMNGVLGTIALKADTTLITDPENGLNVKITNAENRLDSLEGEIINKVSTTEFTPLSQRVTDAEETLSTIDGAGFQRILREERRKADEAELTDEAVLRSALGLHNSYETVLKEVALVRQEANAKVTDNREALAYTASELLGKIDNNTSAILNEQSLRTTETSALAQSIQALSTKIEDPETGLSSKASTLDLTEAVSNEQMARAVSLQELKAEIESPEGMLSGRIADLDEVITNPETGVIAQRISQLKADLEIDDGTITALNDRITESITTEEEARARDVQTLMAGMAVIDKDLTLSEMVDFDAQLGLMNKINSVSKDIALARRELNTKVNNNKEAEASERLLLLAKINDNESAIFNESLARASETESLGQQINAIDTKFTTEIGETNSSVNQLNEAVADEQGARAQSFTQLQSGQVQLDKDVTVSDLIQFDAQLGTLTAIKKLNENVALARRELNTKVNDNKEAEATERLLLMAQIDNNKATIFQESIARVNGDSALAQSISSVSAELNGKVAAVETKANTALDTLGNVTAQYTVKLDVNGYASGFGLMNSGVSSDFIVNADKFAVGAAGQTSKYPFIIENGKVKIDTALIDNLSASNFSANKIVADEVNVTKLSSISSNLGDVTAGSLGIGSTTNGQNRFHVNSEGVITIRDSAGNSILTTSPNTEGNFLGTNIVNTPNIQDEAVSITRTKTQGIYPYFYYQPVDMNSYNMPEESIVDSFIINIPHSGRYIVMVETYAIGSFDANSAIVLGLYHSYQGNDVRTISMNATGVVSPAFNKITYSLWMWSGINTLSLRAKTKWNTTPDGRGLDIAIWNIFGAVR